MAFTAGQETVRAARRSQQRIVAGQARAVASQAHLARQDNFGFINAQMRAHASGMLTLPRAGPFVMLGGAGGGVGGGFRAAIGWR